MDERRRFPRIKEENEVNITVVAGEKNLPEEEINDNQTEDVSVSGTKIKTHIFLPVGTILELDFISKAVNKKIIALGEVKWIKVIIEDESYEVGVEFFGKPSEAINQLGDYISWKQKSNES